MKYFLLGLLLLFAGVAKAEGAFQTPGGLSETQLNLLYLKLEADDEGFHFATDPTMKIYYSDNTGWLGVPSLAFESGTSFAFDAAPNGETWFYRGENGLPSLTFVDSGEAATAVSMNAGSFDFGLHAKRGGWLEGWSDTGTTTQGVLYLESTTARLGVYDDRAAGGSAIVCFSKDMQTHTAGGAPTDLQCFMPNGDITSTRTTDGAISITAKSTSNGTGSSANLIASTNDGNLREVYLSSVPSGFAALPFLQGKAVLFTSALINDVLIHAQDGATLMACSGNAASTCGQLKIDVVSGVTSDAIFGERIHVVFNGAVPSINGASTCASTSIASNSTDTSGQLAGTCDAGETIVMDFNMSFTTNAPFCLVSPADVDAVTAEFYVSDSSTNAVTFTARVTDADSALINYWCPESR